MSDQHSTVFPALKFQEKRRCAGMCKGSITTIIGVILNQGWQAALRVTRSLDRSDPTVSMPQAKT